MAVDVKQRNKTVLELLNGTLGAIKTVVPFDYGLGKPFLLEQSLQISFGVLIGFTGDVKGKFVLKGNDSLFGSIGETMYGMALEGEMLSSFAGELGNMIAGGMATNLAEDGVLTDITSPTIMKGDTALLGFEKAIGVTLSYPDMGDMAIYLVLDN
ncbi:chemotaxis protein CheX [Ferdinandcohnia sp. SAFN-114]|uniref:chemotaxis protein CheX n=1 Tax=Ferdinandcohnia sp. SAFN-114 TaxID=3387275 RepID=UPI003F7F05E1